MKRPDIENLQIDLETCDLGDLNAAGLSETAIQDALKYIRHLEAQHAELKNRAVELAEFAVTNGEKEFPQTHRGQHLKILAREFLEWLEENK